MPALNDEQFFHGTTVDIKNKTLRPSVKTGKENYDYDDFKDGDDRKTHVFMTKHQGHWGGEHPDVSEARAWTWGNSGTHNYKEPGTGYGEAKPYVSKRPHVYEVEPIGKHRVDQAVEGAYMAKSARIKRRIDIPPAAALAELGDHSKNWTRVRGGVQGTFGGVNWDMHVDKDAGAAGAQRDRAAAIDEIREKTRMDPARIHESPAHPTLPFFNDRRPQFATKNFLESTSQPRRKPWADE